jgi:hypothetical protein
MRKNGEEFVIDFACAKSHRVSILHNLTDMRRKALAGFSLRVERVPVAYHQCHNLTQQGGNGPSEDFRSGGSQHLQTKRRCNPLLALSISTDNSSWASLTMHAHSLT